MRTYLSLAPVAAILLLAGCAMPAEGSPSQAAAANTPPPETAAATQVPVNIDDPSSWIIDGAGVGPIQRGSALPAPDSSLGPYAILDDSCPNPGVRHFESTAFPPLTVVGVDGDDEVSLVGVDGWNVPDTLENSPATAAGIVLTASYAELQAAYPDLELTREYGATLFYSVPESGGWIVFTVQDDHVVAITSSPSPTIPAEYCG